MIDVSPNVSVKSPQPEPKNEAHRRSGTPFAIRAACFALVVIAIALGSSLYQQNALITDMKTQLAQSDSDTQKVKADLGRANADSADLRLQVTRSKSLQSDLQAQLTKAQSQQADLQSQLEKTQSDLRAQQDAAKAESAGLKAQASQAADESSSLRKELAQAKTQADDLRAQLSNAQSDIAKLQPLAVKAQTLPVAATFEKQFFGSGRTMHVKNMNPGPLSVKVTVNGSDKAPSKTATIQGGGTLDIDDVAVGAKVVISSEGYESSNLTAH